MHAHEKFHTAVVIAGDLRVDVASARTEHYERPAALPVVEHSSIRQRPEPPRLHDQRDGRALRRADFGRWSTRSAARADLRARRRARAPQPLVHRGSRPASSGRSATRTGTGSRWTRHPRAGPQLRRDGAGRRRLRRPPARRAGGDPGRGRRSRRRSRRLERAGAGAGPASGAATAAAGQARSWCGRLDAAAAPATRRSCRPGGAGWRRSPRAIGGDELLELAGAAAGAPARRPRGGRGGGACRRGWRRRWPRAGEPARVAELLAPHPLEVALRVAAGDDSACRAGRCSTWSGCAACALDIDGDTLRDELGLPESPRVGEVLAELLRRTPQRRAGRRATSSWRRPASCWRRSPREAGDRERQPLARAARAITRPGICALLDPASAAAAWIRHSFHVPPAGGAGDPLAEAWFVGRDWPSGELYARQRDAPRSTSSRPAPAGSRSRSAACDAGRGQRQRPRGRGPLGPVLGRRRPSRVGYGGGRPAAASRDRGQPAGDPRQRHASRSATASWPCAAGRRTSCTPGAAATRRSRPGCTATRSPMPATSSRWSAAATAPADG